MRKRYKFKRGRSIVLYRSDYFFYRKKSDSSNIVCKDSERDVANPAKTEKPTHIFRPSV